MLNILFLNNKDEISKYSFEMTPHSADRLIFLLNTMKCDIIEVFIDDLCIYVHGRNHYILYKFCLEETLVYTNKHEFNKLLTYFNTIKENRGG